MILVLIRCLAQISLSVLGADFGLTESQLSQKLHQYQSIESLAATFKQTKTIKDMSIQIKSEGRFSLQRPHLVKWEILKPSHVLISLSEKEVKIQTESGSDKHIQTFKFNELSSGTVASSMTGLMAWLNLNAVELSHEYDVIPLEKDEYKFIPKQMKSAPFKFLVMDLNSNGHVKKINITENSGDRIEIEFGTPHIVSKK